MLQPAAAAGTNSDVLGEANTRETDGACAPSATGLAVFQTNVVVSPGPLTTNVAEIGMVTQS
jgi:hypothetical protein